jgi:putative tricarboxylic transport membrane protein
MPSPEADIVVDDPTAPADNSPAVVSTRTVEIVVSLLLLALAGIFCFDNWRTGIAWEADGPQPGSTSASCSPAPASTVSSPRS